MPHRATHRMLSMLLLVLSGWAAGQERPTPVRPTPAPVPSNPFALSAHESGRLMADFQGEDAEKREAAAQAFIKAGGTVLNLIQSLERSKTPEVAQRAKQVREEIEKKSAERFSNARAQFSAVYKEGLTNERLELLLKDLNEGMYYMASAQQRRSMMAMANRARQDQQRVERATQALAHFDKQLAGPPEAQGVLRASVQFERAKCLADLRRHAEALAAADDGLKAQEAVGRLKPALLLQIADLQRDLGDAENSLATNLRILNECPKSLEVRNAYENLITYYETNQQVDKQVETLKAFCDAFPLDRAAQDMLFQSLDIFWELDQNYPAALALAAYMQERMDVSRHSVNIGRTLALGYEYVQRDYPKAAAEYKRLLNIFPDMVTKELIDGALKRVEAKQAGTFPKPPGPAEAGPKGALGKFLAAVAKKDEAGLKAVTPKQVAEAYGYDLEQLGPALVFSDVEFLEVVKDERTGITDILVKQYLPDQVEPVKVRVEAIEEDGAWKIAWPPPGEFEDAPMDEPDDAEGEKEPGPQPPKAAPKPPKKEGKTGTGFVLPDQMPEGKKEKE
ncbi:MAG: hypothetical protein M5U26_09670 [Planctomycetota bacterium]|nr:hypothetical protein [Planctomycetota bacterium]